MATKLLTGYVVINTSSVSLEIGINDESGLDWSIGGNLVLDVLGASGTVDMLSVVLVLAEWGGETGLALLGARWCWVGWKRIA